MTSSSHSRRSRRDNASNWSRNLDQALLARGYSAVDYDMPTLIADLRATADEGGHETPHSLLSRLGDLVPLCLPAYRRKNPAGVRFPARDNIFPHVPTVANGRDLGRARLHAVDWILAVRDLGNWYASLTGKDTDGHHLEDVLFDLLMAFPDIDIDEKTPRMLAGRLTFDGLIEAIEFYDPSSEKHWTFDFNDDEDDEDGTPAAPMPNLSGTAFSWGDR